MPLSFGFGRGQLLPKGQGAPPWTPASVSNLLLWLDANDSTTLFQTVGGTAATADTNPVGSWLDKSGNSNHASMASATQRPKLKTGIHNGKNTLRFDGNDYFSLPNFHNFGTDDSTMFIVARTETPGSWVVLFEQKGANGKRYLPCYTLGVAGGIRYYSYHNGAVGSFLSQSFASGTTFVPNSILKAVRNGTASSLTLNNTTTISGTLADFDSSGGFTYIGNSLYNEYMRGDICEILCYGRALSASEQTSVNDYLKAKWATP
jgi:hypothetical protein